MAVHTRKDLIGCYTALIASHCVPSFPAKIRYVASGDETEILRDGYWASYNIPFFEKVYNMSGYPEVANKVGPDATYQLCPRAKIFRRDQGHVKDLASMQYIMRYNG